MQAVSDVYTIPQEHLDFCATIGQIAREKIAPRSAEIDERAEYPWDVRKLLAEQDILGLAVPDRVRRHRDGHADAEHGGRGDRQGRCVVRADPDGAGAGHAADPAVRLRRAEGALPAEVRDRRVVAGVRAVRARGRLGSRRDEDDGREGRRGVGDQRHQELDLQPGRRRLLHLLRRHRPREQADDRVRRGGRPARASASASSSTSSASAPRRPASRSSRTCGCPART